MLSNASIDVAFHDTDTKILLQYENIIILGYIWLELIINLKLINFIILISENKKFKTYSLNIDNINSSKELYENIEKRYNNKDLNIKDYIEQFFVGLLEGDGTITVDFINNNKKRVRIIISLKNLNENQQMIDLLVKYIGGRKTIERNNKYVTWIASNRSDIVKTLGILAKYPLLTTSKKCQLDFAIDFINNNNYITKNEFIKLRNNKFNYQNNLINYFNNNFSIPFYFSPWLSGFIEAEGHFKLIKRIKTNSIQNSQFIIGQNNDEYLLKAINIYLKNNHSIISNTDLNYYKIHISNKYSRDILNNHFKLYPLLGYKYSQYKWWLINQSD